MPLTCALRASGRRQLAVAVAVPALDHLGEGPAELIHRHDGVPIGVQMLEPIDHALAHGIQPQVLVFLEAQLAVLVGVELGELVGPALVDFGLGEFAVGIAVILLD